MQQYDDFPPIYDRTMLDDRGYMAPTTAAMILAQKLASDAEVLDTGGRTGVTGLEFSRRGFSKATGVDISQPSSALAQARGLYKDLRREDLNAPLPFEADAFEAAQCVGILSYILEIPTQASEVSNSCNWSARKTDIRLDALRAYGLIENDVHGTYVNSTTADGYLVTGEVGFIGGIIDHQRLQWPLWTDIGKVFAADQPLLTQEELRFSSEGKTNTAFQCAMITFTEGFLDDMLAWGGCGSGRTRHGPVIRSPQRHHDRPSISS